MKIIIKILKKIVLAGFTLILFNMMVSPLNFVIPINIITILFGTVFGMISIPFFATLLIFFF